MQLVKSNLRLGSNCESEAFPWLNRPDVYNCRYAAMQVKWVFRKRQTERHGRGPETDGREGIAMRNGIEK